MIARKRQLSCHMSAMQSIVIAILTVASVLVERNERAGLVPMLASAVSKFHRELRLSACMFALVKAVFCSVDGTEDWWKLVAVVHKRAARGDDVASWFRELLRNALVESDHRPVWLRLDVPRRSLQRFNRGRRGELPARAPSAGPARPVTHVTSALRDPVTRAKYVSHLREAIRDHPSPLPSPSTFSPPPPPATITPLPDQTSNRSQICHPCSHG
jgi:hypothetical protein